MTQPKVTTVEDVTTYLGGLAGVDPTQVSAAYQAAEAWVGARCRWFVPPAGVVSPVWPDPPADLVLAVNLLTARYLARRNSPDGFVGMGDLGPARVGATDRDVDSLTAPYRRVVFG